MKKLLICLCMSLLPLLGLAQRVTLHAVDRPASDVFRALVEQTGKNFVYSSDLLTGVRVTVNADNRPLKKVLSEMFCDKDIDFKIKGSNVILTRRRIPTKKSKHHEVRQTPRVAVMPDTTLMLEEILVLSRLEAPEVESSEMGARKITGREVRDTPTLLGESDVIKTLQTMPGVSESVEGMAGMSVHGGDTDQNLFMLDNVPLYQVNHLGGLFSAFNPDIIRHVDFFKTSVPAKYDGRLSSFMDVRTTDGHREGHHGTARLGLTSGSIGISGPISRKTTYVAGLRRSWLDVLTIPLVAMINAASDEEKTRMRYAFTDLNAKVIHRFDRRFKGFVSVYYGSDILKTGDESKNSYMNPGWYYRDRYDLSWGNLVAQTGLNWRINPALSAEFTAAYTRYFSDMKYDDVNRFTQNGPETMTHVTATTHNNINDWVFRADFDWNPADNSRVRFGANYVRHSFLPGHSERRNTHDTETILTRDSTWSYRGNEVNLYIEDDWKITDRLRANVGLHGSLFHVDGRVRHGLSPRASINFRPTEATAVKASYTRTVQYVHHLAQSYLSLPTDQWVPVTGNFKPETADKVAAGVYWQSRDGGWTFSAEAYWKWMHNLVEYKDEYYLRPMLAMWNSSLTSGRGTAKGIDLKAEKTIGKLTGHIAYSLVWADRTFRDKNGGKTYPARFDQRHSIHIGLDWKVNEKVGLHAAWTGHSGNRFTLLTQTWETPVFGGYTPDYDAPLRAPLNNYRLPFYHRLDLSCTVRNSRGYWTFGLYNAYCHMNAIGIRRGYKYEYATNDDTRVFQKVTLFPLIPSISYTWEF